MHKVILKSIAVTHLKTAVTGPCFPFVLKLNWWRTEEVISGDFGGTVVCFGATEWLA